VTCWWAAFGAEALPDDHQDAARPIDARLNRPGLLWLWEVDGEPVSTAYLSPLAAQVSRVSGVYTPPDLRGRGYASACVATMSQRALDGGAVACMLYTDLANPTSNKIYQAIGYRPVADVQEWRFRQG
jgi:predicted GNAT family acetyltransferase